MTRRHSLIRSRRFLTVGYWNKDAAGRPVECRPPGHPRGWVAWRHSATKAKDTDSFEAPTAVLRPGTTADELEEAWVIVAKLTAERGALRRLGWLVFSAVAFLVLLAGAARAGIVAADFFAGAALRRLCWLRRLPRGVATSSSRCFLR